MADDKIVNVDTDNLDDFQDLFSGKATAAPVTPEDPVVDDDPTDPEVDPLADPTDDGNEPADPDPDEDKPLFVPKKKTVQERINELTAKAREAERREAELARQLEELKAGETKEPVTKAPVTASGEPDPDDTLENGDPKYPLGELDHKYIRDLMKFTIEQETAQRETQAEIDRQLKAQEEREAALTQTRQALQQDWSGRVAETTKTVPDFVEKVQTLEETFTALDPAYSEYLATAIMQMENGTDVLYHLSNNLEEAKQIADLGPVLATIALGRIEASYVKGKEPKQPKVSEAPEPPKVINRGNNSVHKVAPDTDDLEAFEKEFFRRK